MGFDSHDSATRGTYLFRNDNAKNLSAADKAKLNYILKAFDTNELIEVNLTLKQINFPHLEIERTPTALRPETKTLVKEPLRPARTEVPVKKTLTLNHKTSLAENLLFFRESLPKKARGISHTSKFTRPPQKVCQTRQLWDFYHFETQQHN